MFSCLYSAQAKGHSAKMRPKFGPVQAEFRRMTSPKCASISIRKTPFWPLGTTSLVDLDIYQRRMDRAFFFSQLHGESPVLLWTWLRQGGLIILLRASLSALHQNLSIGAQEDTHRAVGEGGTSAEGFVSRDGSFVRSLRLESTLCDGQLTKCNVKSRTKNQMSCFAQGINGK